MIFDTERTLRTINNAPNPNIIKIFFYIAFHQPDDGIKGYIINKKQLQFDLKLGRTVFFDSMRWLNKNLVIHELKLTNKSDFMVNPYIVMNNGDRDARIAEWSNRCRIDSMKYVKKLKLKRLRELKSDKS